MDNQRRLLIACVTLLTGWLIWPWFFLPGYRASREYSPEATCRNSLLAIRAAKDAWAQENRNATNGTPVAVSNVAVRIKSGPMPECRRGGDYGIGSIGEEPRCTAHGTIRDIDDARARQLKQDKEGATACLAAYFIVACVLALLPATVAIIGRRRKQPT